MTKKGQKIRPHKGGRTTLIAVRALPETKAIIERIAKANDQSPADVIELWAREKATELELAPSE